MRTGTIIVDQVDIDGQIVGDFDTSLSPSELSRTLALWFPNLTQVASSPVFYLGTYKGHTFAIRCKNVTYLGNPHPRFKKRIQIADDLYSFYHSALSLGAEPLLLGIYSYGENTIFVDFKIDTYIQKAAHNSSAHIYSSDIAAATEDGYFQKEDFFGNVITAFRPDMVNVFLDSLFGIPEPDVISTDALQAESTYQTVLNDSTPIVIEPLKNSPSETNARRFLSYSQIFQEHVVPQIHEFFSHEDSEWHGIDCYQKMIASNYKNKYQPEWVGFFLEYEFARFIESHKLESIVQYYQDKTNGGIDLDLFFPEIQSFGDLKAHSEDSRGIQGNDWSTIFSILDNPDPNNHIYYIVCEHSTEKDSLHEYEVTRYWNTVQCKTDLMSYHKRMKNRVVLKRVYILDINPSNQEYLTMFRQGINSNGKPRPPKIMIEQDNLHHFILDELLLQR